MTSKRSGTSKIVVNGQPRDMFTMVPHAFARCGHIDPGPKALLILMVSRGSQWDVWIEQMAGDLGTTRKTVSKWIASAAETPYLVVAGTGEFNYRGHPTYVYYVDLTKPCAQCIATEQKVHGEKVPVEHGSKVPTKKNKGKKTKPLSRSKQASTASEPHVIPDDWRPNRTHSVAAQKLGIDLGHAHEEFLSSATAQDEKRSDWNKTFGAFLNEYADGRHEDVF